MTVPEKHGSVGSTYPFDVNFVDVSSWDIQVHDIVSTDQCRRHMIAPRYTFGSLREPSRPLRWIPFDLNNSEKALVQYCKSGCSNVMRSDLCGSS